MPPEYSRQFVASQIKTCREKIHCLEVTRDNTNNKVRRLKHKQKEQEERNTAQ